MNKDRYLQALAAEVNASVEALLSNSSAQPPAQRFTSRVTERQPAVRTSAISGLPQRDRTQSALFPGVNPIISRFDSDKD